MKYTAPRGTKDILPDEVGLWQYLENCCREVFNAYDYKEIRTPIFESTDLFTRSIGTTTDIVKKEMYTFPDRKGRSLTLRPEETAPVVRAALENNLISTENLTKLYYLGSMFRYERPQAGRQRQFHQAGVEAFGSSDPMLDAEVIQLAVHLFQSIGLGDLEVNLNSVGCRACQPEYRQAIQKYFKEHIKDMCADCQERLESNPLRILDCKEAHCQKYLDKAPASVDHLCEECKNHFSLLVGWLDSRGIKYRINKRLVRGLDYYTKTAFEVVAKQLGAQNAICGGGRYDNLVEELGGKSVPAIGFAIGMERVVEILKQQPQTADFKQGVGLYFATIGEEAKKVGFELATQARSLGISAEVDFMGKSLKAQMKTADRLKADYVYIIGEDELAKQAAILKNMKTAEQAEVKFADLFKNFEGECECGDDCGCK